MIVGDAMVRFWVGVSGFGYTGWIGTFYPAGAKGDMLLQHYSEKLNSVEINSTFYQMPNERTIRKWAEATAGNFRFSFKANRRITHIKKLRNAASETASFADALTPLKGKLGPLLVQLPPFLRFDRGLLEGFLREKPGPISVVLEPRHTSWFSDEVYEVLERYNVALCVADTAEMKPVFRGTADFAYARLRQDNYSRTDLEKWSDKLAGFAQDGTDCYAYFKHDENGKAARMAVEFARLLS
jgi:uncharacterized protein YecE (DUF72 family)